MDFLMWFVSKEAHMYDGLILLSYFENKQTEKQIIK